MNCDNCGRATGPLLSAAHNGRSYCQRAGCQDAYEEDTGEEYQTLRDKLEEID